MNEKLIGRKLYVKWGEHMYIAIEKVPAGDKKLLEMSLNGSDLMLCDITEDENGQVHENILGCPSDNRTGYQIGELFTNVGFWKTPFEAGEIIEADGKRHEIGNG